MARTSNGSPWPRGRGALGERPLPVERAPTPSVAAVAAAGATAARLRRWLLVALGFLCVGLAAIGAVVPGLPTTVFLLAAAWCFTRSCPWLEERVLGCAVFRPFRPYLAPGTRMPRRAQIAALVLMWAAIATSVVTVGNAGAGAAIWLVRVAIVVAGAVGTYFIVRAGRAAA
ncbi:MAG TPA: YbaN family protein [Candidatus Krumholzibacteria bacterium]|nr:YbaN family protein [Candidatus Krumholzibacteria bacterium]HPD72365.1 YbaN family protein [Candidatus Krumholzibacteria bacterium]HRY40703.1 YbaN family protein [Candidatus Krumholzibacteria bacterium]